MSNQPSTSADFDRFRDLARRLIAVPKSEVPKHVPKKRVKAAAKKTKGK
jgi:hypothetical protein